MLDDTKDRFWPRSFSLEPLQENPVSLINEPVRGGRDGAAAGGQAETAACRLGGEFDPYASAADAAGGWGAGAPRDQQRETVRALYVATQNQLQALVACLELEGLE